MCTSIVEPRDGAKALLARRVPHLEPQDSAGIWIVDLLSDKGGADSAHGCSEGCIRIEDAIDERCFANALTAQHDELALELLGGDRHQTLGKGRIEDTVCKTRVAS
jgi:hypothetical protein